MTLWLATRSIRRWTVACLVALFLHGAAFAVAYRHSRNGAERMAGEQQADLGAVSAISRDALSDLIQTAEPVAPSSSDEKAMPVETPERIEEAAADLAEPEAAPQELETFSNAALVALPAEVEAETVEPIEDRQKRQPARKLEEKQPRRETAAVSRSGGGAGGSQSDVSGAAELAGYKDRVRARVAGRARSPGGSGLVIVRFTVTASGGVAGASIVRGASGALNSAALSAVNGGFPPIPPGLPRSLSFTVPIQFR